MLSLPRKVLGFFLILVWILFISNIVVSAEESSDIIFEVYHNTEYKLSINYPIEWQIQEKYMGTVAMFLSPQESPADQFRENLNIIVQDLSEQPMTVSEYTQISLMQLNQYMTDFKQVVGENTVLLNENAYQIIYTAKQGQFDLKIMQCWFIKNNFAYILTYTAEESNYDQYYSIIDKMKNSFQLAN